MKFSSKLISDAWAIFHKAAKTLAISWGEAIKQAVSKIKFQAKVAALEIGKAVKFEFRKADGTVRVAFAIPFPSTFEIKGTGKETPADSIFYWDAILGAPRSFKIFNLLNVA